MCQMIIHATARDTTMLQAVAHNIHTTASDLETLLRVLEGRGQCTPQQSGMIADMRESLEEIEADLLEMFTSAVTTHPHTAGDHSACDAAPQGAEVAEHAHTVQSV